jgi:NADH:ubiquinone oxidoreductase subunit 5 (subunit L)/multisubunit Na+/H+ antiporter MnhA subunit
LVITISVNPLATTTTQVCRRTARPFTVTVPSVEPMYSRFFAFLGLFAFGMYVLVVSDNLLTMFVGWEIMGLCSYLLIGFWYGKPSARNAAIKAFMTTRIGDVFMLLGIAFLYSVTGHSPSARSSTATKFLPPSPLFLRVCLVCLRQA